MWARRDSDNWIVWSASVMEFLRGFKHTLHTTVLQGRHDTVLEADPVDKAPGNQNLVIYGLGTGSYKSPAYRGG